MKKKLIFTALCLIGYLHAQSPDNGHKVYYKNGEETPTRNIQSGKAANSQKTSVYAPGYYSIQVTTLPDKSQKAKLTQAGIVLLEYIPNNTYWVHLTQALNNSKLAELNIHAISDIPLEQKLAPSLFAGVIAEHAKTEGDNAKLVVMCFSDAQINPDDFTSLGASIENQNNELNKLTVTISQETYRSLAAINYVKYVAPVHAPIESHNTQARATHRTNVLNNNLLANSRDLNGQGVVIGVGDGGYLREHADLQNRYTNAGTDAAGFDHQMHVSGIIAGAGNLQEEHRGAAPKATLITTFFEDMINNAPQYHTQDGVDITNNSWGITCTSHPNGGTPHGGYDNISEEVDEQLDTYNNLLHVFSAGNDGAQPRCGNITTVPYGTVTGSYQPSKNILTVGSITKDYEISPFSSRGPALDGRIKPEIVGVGSNVISTTPGNTYQAFNGTSMSAPGVTGVLTLLKQRYRQLNNNNEPSAALLKALACNTADDLGRKGPDFTFGYGKINGLRAVEVLESGNYTTGIIDHGEQNSLQITVPENIAQLNVMVYWTDKAGAATASKALVNDIDLLIQHGDINYLPWILNADPAHLEDLATKGADHTNNIEQVTIDNPSSGSYTINLSGFAIPMGAQDYVIVYEFVEEGLTITYPSAVDHIYPGQTSDFQWDRFGLTEDATLEYTTDGGITWTAIPGTISPDAHYAQIEYPSVENAAIVQIRMTSGEHVALSDPFVIMERPQAFDVKYVCSGALEATWSAVDGATGYEVFVMGPEDTEMQPFGVTTETNMQLPVEFATTEHWFSVRARKGDFASIRTKAVKYKKAISVFPYRESFNTTFTDWSITGANPSWEIGIPNGSIISGAANGNTAFVTNLTGAHNNDELSYLVSPCFDLSSVNNDLYFSYNQFLDLSSDDQAVFVDYSTDGGTTWNRLGKDVSNGVNWYNTGDTPHAGFSWRNKTSAEWELVAHLFPTELFGTQKSVIFRIGFHSISGALSEGVGIDAVSVGFNIPGGENCLATPTFQYNTLTRSRDEFFEFKRTSDDGWIASGEAAPNNIGSRSTMIVKMNSEQEIEWTKTYVTTPISFDVTITNIIEVSDGYILGGEQAFCSNCGSNAGIISKIDKSGEHVWSYTVRHPGGVSLVSSVEDLKQTFDGGIISVGTFASSNGGDPFLIKLDNTGTLEWIEIYEVDGVSRAGKSVIVDGNTGYLVSGDIGFSGGQYLLRVDLDGTPQDYFSFGNTPASSNYRNYVLKPSVFGGYIGIHDQSAFRINNSGEVQWWKDYSELVGIVDITEKENGNIGILARKSNSKRVEPGGPFYAYTETILMTLDANGNLENSKIIGDVSKGRIPRNIEPACNGYFIAGQYNNRYGWMAHVNDGLFAGCDEFEFTPTFTEGAVGAVVSSEVTTYEQDVLSANTLISTTIETPYFSPSCTYDDLVFTQTSDSLVAMANAGISWGDIDNDGDLDLAYSGETGSSCAPFVGCYSDPDLFILRNNNGSMNIEHVTNGAIHEGELHWIDNDNDGVLELFITGQDEVSGRNRNRLLENDGIGALTPAFDLTPPLGEASTDWADVDNDGDMDVIITGREFNSPFKKTFLYLNQQNQGDYYFELAENNDFTAVENGDASFADYDNDGDMDVLISGATDVDFVSHLYQNNDGVFSFVNTPFSGRSEVDAEWADYDSDGDLDLAIVGNTIDGEPYITIYGNNNSIFSAVENIIEVEVQYGGDLEWGDIDNDGDLDLYVAGIVKGDFSSRISRVYINEGGHFLSSIDIADKGIDNAAAAFGDMDDDGDLDLMLAGRVQGSTSSSSVRWAGLFENSSNLEPNTAPSSPSNLLATVNNTNVLLSWDKGMDNETPQNGLTYNLAVSWTPLGGEVMNPMANMTTGKRKVARMGNVQCNTSWELKNLAPGTYFWTVQAIDNNFTGSPFATEGSFTVVDENLAIEITSESSSCVSDTLTFEAIPTGNIVHYAWDFGQGATPQNAIGKGPHKVIYNEARAVSVTVEGNYGAVQDSRIVYISPLPSISDITGESVVSSGETHNYTTTSNPMYTYSWETPPGATISSGQGTNLVSVTFANESGEVAVGVTDHNGCKASKTKTVTVLEYSELGITGNTTICKQVASENYHSQSYSVTNTAGATYNWTVTGASISGGQGTSQINVAFPAGVGTVNIHAEMIQNGATTGEGSIDVNMNLRPSSISMSGPSGHGAVCTGQEGVEYAATGTNTTSFNWTVPPGTVITSSQTTGEITVSFGNQGGNIEVYGVNGIGCTSYSGANTWVGPVPCNTKTTHIHSSEVVVYPNPATDFVTMPGAISLKLIDQLGNVILQQKGKSLNLSQVTGGVYTLVGDTGNDIKTVIITVVK